MANFLMVFFFVIKNNMVAERNLYLSVSNEPRYGSENDIFCETFFVY